MGDVVSYFTHFYHGLHIVNNASWVIAICMDGEEVVPEKVVILFQNVGKNIAVSIMITIR